MIHCSGITKTQNNQVISDKENAVKSLFVEIQTVFMTKFKQQIKERDYIILVYEGFFFSFDCVDVLIIGTPNGDRKILQKNQLNELEFKYCLYEKQSTLMFQINRDDSINFLQKNNELLVKYNQPPNRSFCVEHLQELKTSLEKINDTKAENLVAHCPYNENMKKKLRPLLFGIQRVFKKKFEKQIKEIDCIKFVYEGFCFDFSEDFDLSIYTTMGDCREFEYGQINDSVTKIRLALYNSVLYFYKDEETNIQKNNDLLDKYNLQKNNDLLTQYNQPINRYFCLAHLQELKISLEKINDSQAENLVAQCNYTEEMRKKRLENLLNNWIPKIAKAFFDLFPKQIETQFSFKMVITGFCVEVFKKQRFLLINPMWTYNNKISYNQRTNKIKVSNYYVDMKETPSGRLIFTNNKDMYNIAQVENLLKKHNQSIDTDWSEEKFKELLVTIQTWNPNSQKLFPQSCAPLRKRQYRASFLLFLILCMTCFFTLLIRKKIKKII